MTPGALPAGGTLLVFCQHCKLDAAELGPTCAASKNGNHSTMSRWVKVAAQPSLFAAMNEKTRPLDKSGRGASQEV
jgi:hypothetical protein